MNNSLSNPAVSNPWKRLKLQYVALACGLALAAGTAISLDTSPVKPSSASPAPYRATAAWVTYTSASRPEATFYLVSSEADAAKAQRFEDEAEWARFDARDVTTRRNVVILLARTEAEQATARHVADGQRATIEELAGHVTIVDWLGR